MVAASKTALVFSFIMAIIPFGSFADDGLPGEHNTVDHNSKTFVVLPAWLLAPL
jgi:hypothetical protein